MAHFDHESFLAGLTRKPGVYRMLDRGGEVLYVGKARNLKNRVTSYFRAAGLQSKTMAMVAKMAQPPRLISLRSAPRCRMMAL